MEPTRNTTGCRGYNYTRYFTDVNGLMFSSKAAREEHCANPILVF